MLALRNLTRSAPRSFARLSTRAARPQTSLFRQAAVFQPSWTQSVSRFGASFHSSAVRNDGRHTDEEIIAKLKSEISMEEGLKEDDELSSNIREYLENSAYEIVDTPGHQEVVLTRTFGDEKIRVTFTTADLNNNADPEASEDPAYYDEGVDDIIGESQSGGANTKGAINQGQTRNGNVKVAPEDSVAPADREELDDEFEEEEQSASFPARTSIRIERPGKGVLAIEAVAQDGDFIIHDILSFTDAELADPKTAEKDWQRRTLYTGPPFGNLDEDLQILLEKYLEERGINTRMALFIPDYIDHKEQKEYVKWLNNLKNFIEE